MITREGVRSLLQRARQEVIDVASGRRRWTMCVPVQEDTDTDRLLMNALSSAEKVIDAADALADAAEMFLRESTGTDEEILRAKVAAYRAVVEAP